MNELKDQFIQRSIAALRELSAGGHDALHSAESFRRLHTIKGTARTFGLDGAAKLAHEIESMLAGSTAPSVIAEGLRNLAALLGDGEGVQKIDAVSDVSVDDRGRVLISALPCEVFKKLADNEKNRLFTAAGRRMELYRLDTSFPVAQLVPGVRALKEKLDLAGEVIAALPGGSASGRLAFKFYFAAQEAPEIDDVVGELTGLNVPAGPLKGAIEKLGAHAVDLAYYSAKKVNFICSIEGIAPSDRDVSAIFDILLHLVRNAIDHAFSARGNIFVSLCIKDDGTQIVVEDDGAGIDPQKVRENAAGGESLTDDEAIGLIFSPGFSTAGEITETSGRGVGLDAVKTLVESSGGTIRVRSALGAGTAFKIYLPAS